MTEAEHDLEHDALMSPHTCDVFVQVSVDPLAIKCPRCWHYHRVVLNHDALCDRCCDAIIEGWPDHASVPFIVANREAQKRRFDGRVAAS